MPQAESKTTSPTPQTQPEDQNYAHFRDSLSTLLLRHFSSSLPATTTTKPRSRKAKSGRKTGIKPVERPAPSEEDAANDAEELADFVEYLAGELFEALPEDLRTLDYAAVRNDGALAVKYDVPLSASVVEELAVLLPPSTIDSVVAYNLIPADDPSALTTTFLPALLHAYLGPLISPPPSIPMPNAPRATSCELCDRDWIPLTYHHLIPRSVHTKVMKRGWHEEWRLNSVAWLCRACHSFVHGVAGNEELAKEWYTVELLAEREDVKRWVGWVGRIRWKSR